MLVSPGRFELPARPSEGCARSTRRGGCRVRVFAPGAGLEPAVALRRVVNSHLACHSPHPDKDGERTCRSGPHRGASPGRRTPFRVPPGSRTRLSCLEGKVLAARTAVRIENQIERPAGTAPTPPTWQAGVPLTTPWPRTNCLELRAGLAPACDEVAARRLSISVQRSERTKQRRRRESNARDCRRPRFSKPACYHSSTSPMGSPRGDSNA